VHCVYNQETADGVMMLFLDMLSLALALAMVAFVLLVLIDVELMRAMPFLFWLRRTRNGGLFWGAV
jgi:hypothetical protein